MVVDAGSPAPLVSEWHGDVDISNAHALAEQVCARIAGSGTSSVVIDLGRVTFLDSSGISALVMIRAAASASGVDLTLRHVPDRVQTLFQLSTVSCLFATE
jgi:anti-sigma B factor antagonist